MADIQRLIFGVLLLLFALCANAVIPTSSVYHSSNSPYVSVSEEFGTPGALCAAVVSRYTQNNPSRTLTMNSCDAGGWNASEYAGSSYLGEKYGGISSKAGSCPANSTSNGSGGCVCSSGYTEVNGSCEAKNDDRDRCASFASIQTLPGGALVQDYRLQGNVADGAQFCMPGAFDSPSKGCKVSFSRDAFLDYGGGASVTEGTFSMSPNSSTVDQSCAVGPDTSPPKVPEKEKCPSGYTGTVNGVEVCVNKVPNSGADGGSNETETNDGTETTTRRVDRSTNCDGDKCTTTTTTTTTRRNNSTGASSTTITTETSTTSKPGFCQENPSSKLCKDGKEDGSSFGGSCGAGFTCEGDAIQCAMAQEQHRRACKLFDDQTPESQLYNAEKSKTGKRTGDLPGNETIAFGQSMYDSSNALGPGTCISDLPVDVLGQTVSLPISQICPHLATLRLALLAFGALLWVLIVLRG